MSKESAEVQLPGMPQWNNRILPTGGMIVGCHGSGHTRLREHEWVLTLTVCTRHCSCRRSLRRFTTGDATMERPHISNGRDDCQVPWIRTYSPERARMGTDTDCVHPTIVPVKGVCGGSITGDATMERPHIANGRDDCRVPWIRTYSPERGTDTDCVHPTIVPVEGVCGGSITGDAMM